MLFEGARTGDEGLALCLCTVTRGRIGKHRRTTAGDESSFWSATKTMKFTTALGFCARLLRAGERPQRPHRLDHGDQDIKALGLDLSTLHSKLAALPRSAQYSRTRGITNKLQIGQLILRLALDIVGEKLQEGAEEVHGGELEHVGSAPRNMRHAAAEP